MLLFSGPEGGIFCQMFSFNYQICEHPGVGMFWMESDFFSASLTQFS